MEKKIFIKGINLLEFYGINNVNLNTIKSFFPKLKIVARGSEFNLIGEEEIIEQFESKLQLILKHIQKYNSINKNNIENIMLSDGYKILEEFDNNIILYGNGGTPIKPRTYNQRKLVDLIYKKDMVFAIGPAGTGKTYTAVAMAVRALKNKEVKKIILTRPAVEAGENLGFLPGDLKEKLDPYLQPLYDALFDMIPTEKLQEYIENRVIEIAPLAFMRGRTLDKSFVILDEAQNSTEVQLKMFLTRMGASAKFTITGDMSQIDLPSRQKSGLGIAIDKLKNIEGIGIVKLNQNDVIRHKIVKEIIKAFENKK